MLKMNSYRGRCREQKMIKKPTKKSLTRSYRTAKASVNV